MKQVFTMEEQEFIRGYASKLLAGVETTKEEDARLYELRDKFWDYMDQLVKAVTTDAESA